MYLRISFFVPGHGGACTQGLAPKVRGVQLCSEEPHQGGRQGSEELARQVDSEDQGAALLGYECHDEAGGSEAEEGGEEAAAATEAVHNEEDGEVGRDVGADADGKVGEDVPGEGADVEHEGVQADHGADPAAEEDESTAEEGATE